MADPRARLVDRLGAVLVWTGLLLIVLLLAWMVGDLVVKGWSRLSWEFLTAAPRRSGRAGGIGPILVSTALIVGCCTAVVLPLGLGIAILLSSARGRIADAIRLSLDVLAGAPSIVMGLFGFAFFCQVLGLGFSILSGGLTLACMSLPVVARIAEAGLRAVPRDLAMGAAALGMSRITTLRTILIPAALPTLSAALVLGIGRALAETAALVFTSGYVDRWPGSLLDSGRALSVHIYDLAMNVPGGDAPAAASGLVLVAGLAILDVLAGLLLARWANAKATA